jgi:hypothetical protein
MSIYGGPDLGITTRPEISPKKSTPVLFFNARNRKSYPRSGTTWYNLIDNGYDAVHVNGPSFSASGKYFGYDGTNDYSYIKNLWYGDSYSRRINELTVLCWMRTTFNSGNVLSNGGGTGDNWSFIDFDRSDVFNFYPNGNGRLGFAGRSSNSGGFSGYYDLVGSSSINDGDWHFVGVTFSVSAQKIIFYIDGEIDSTNTANGSMNGLGYGAKRYGFIGDGSEAGSQNSTRNYIYYQGDIASLIMYDDIALSENRINRMYRAKKGRFGL